MSNVEQALTGVDEEEFEPRLIELIVISSMYPDQLFCSDLNVEKEIKKENHRFRYNDTIKAAFRIFDSEQSRRLLLEINFDLPEGYPDRKNLHFCWQIIDPDLYRLLNKVLTNKFNELIAINNLIELIPKIIEIWKENLDEVRKNSLNNSKSFDKFNEKQNQNSSTLFSRYWIFSHHIYSSLKRKSIIKICKNFHLNGFMLSGKPGE
ncbi:hypothetical protein QR98_0087090 [Sarcoptes scabiei]|uniref:RWD domain-containing protein n=1 Tax=Sarcoptes scabiei TaxID=52283 RepID=A0A132AH78_SARSC|nr:hypothetical protein QR98_0087090 [Sarcoptes scabiei]